MEMIVNGEVPAKEEATVYVRELDLFVTVILLENTIAAKIITVLTRHRPIVLELI